MTEALHGQDLSDTWTPKLVGERLIEAVRWARYNAGPTGPAPVRALMPTFLPSDDDFELEGWGERERMKDDDPPADIKRYSPKKISQIVEALHWQSRYLGPELKTSAEILALWVRCKAYRGNFDKAVKARLSMTRQHAYNYRDRALSSIAQGLTRDGIAP